MSNEFLSPPRSPRRVLLAGVLGLCLLVVISLVIALSIRTSPHPATGAAGGATTDSSGPAGATDGQGPLRVVAGHRLVDGVATGFPHTLVGAVSAAAEQATQLGSTLDPQRGAAIARVLADPSWTEAANDYAAGVVKSRVQLGLSASGALPPEAGRALGAVAYQVRGASADQVTVLLLGYLTTSTPAAGTQTRIGVFPAMMRWTSGDWKVEQGGGGDYDRLMAQPGSAAAKALGWQDLIR